MRKTQLLIENALAHPHAISRRLIELNLLLLISMEEEEEQEEVKAGTAMCVIIKNQAF